MPSITNMIDLIGQLDSPYITVHQDRCILVRNRNADCLRCAEVCTSACISFDGEALSITPERCIGCGTCATVCPTCCLEAHHPSDAQLLSACRNAAAGTSNTVTIACAELLDRAHNLVDPDKVARVECLGRVDESLLSTLVAEGLSNIALVHGACDTCPHNTGRAMVETILDTENILLDAWKTEANIHLTTKLPQATRLDQHDYDKSKRAAFEQGKQSLSEASAQAMHYAVTNQTSAKAPLAPSTCMKVMEDGTLPHFLPDRREKLLDALAQLGTPDDVMIETRLWGHVVIDADRCSSCRMCAVFCPTGALRKYDGEDGTFGVAHYPGDCVKCRCCATICPDGALTISEEVFAQEMLEGMTDIYEMKPPAIRKGKAHTIWHTAKTFTNIHEVYER